MASTIDQSKLSLRALSLLTSTNTMSSKPNTRAIMNACKTRTKGTSSTPMQVTTVTPTELYQVITPSEVTTPTSRLHSTTKSLTSTIQLSPMATASRTHSWTHFTIRLHIPIRSMPIRRVPRVRPCTRQ